MERLRRAALLVFFLGCPLVWAVQDARATTTPLWVPLQLNPGTHVPSSELQAFRTVTGWPGQATTPGYYPYVKGTRTYEAHLPEQWYLHAAGQRVRDTVFHGYVMDAANPGWQAYVAKLCGSRCFLDAMGANSLSRAQPDPGISKADWQQRLIALLQAVRPGRKVVPNSIKADALPIGQVTGTYGAEFWDGHKQLIQGGRVWLKVLDDCDFNLARYLLYRGKGDRYFCAGLAHPWSVSPLEAGPSVGHALGPARHTPSGWVRIFMHARLRVNIKEHTWQISR